MDRDDGDRPVASAGLLILDWPPHPFDPEGELRGYLLNVYVEPEYRKRGLAHELVERCMAKHAGAAFAWSRCTVRKRHGRFMSASVFTRPTR
jgi:ribosomal protein S18 acetylase RimI-like enzyme